MDFGSDVMEGISEHNGNVYRTKKYIVRQHIKIQTDTKGIKYLYSVDSYYRRTKGRDMLFEKFFLMNGKRIKTAMFTRKYYE